MTDGSRTSVPGQSRSHVERPALGADLIIPALAVAFTTYYLIGTAILTWEAKPNGVIVGVILYALVAVQVARVCLRVGRGEATLGFGDLFDLTTPQKRRIALVVITALFILALPWLGVSTSLFLALFASMWVLGERDWRVLIGVALLTTATVYLLFITFLQTRLPTGPAEMLIEWLSRGGA